MPNALTKPGQLCAMISSTAADLPEHREQVEDACLRTGIFPIGMEQLPARDASGIAVSLEMVDQADIYIGVYAWRYGWVPDGEEISITEMEFNHALERKERGELKEILIFLMHENHPLTSAKMVEADADAQAKLAKFKQRASKGRVRLEFKSAEELRGLAVQSLADCKRRIEAMEGNEPAPISFHPPNLIPTAPAPYIAHPYSLLQTSEVVGRRDELKLLTDWVTTNKIIPPGICLFNVVAIGGMGKSALTWKWFNDIAPNELPHLKGRMWWSFYESDAYFENFVIRALAYTAGMTEAAVRELQPHEREDQLFHLLDQQPFLLVLDGLERILLAYARMDAAHLEALGAQASLPADSASETLGLPVGAVESMPSLATPAGKDACAPREDHRLRQCTDLRTGRFLQRLPRVRASRVLVSTRLYPAELQTNTARPLPGCYPLFLNGLTNDDALALWRAFIGSERSGTSEQLLPLFNAFGNYPLLVRALAGRVASYRPAPGDYDGWRKDHPDFNPAELDLRNAKTHVLHYALEGLGEAQRQVLHTMAAFRMPTTWDTLRAVLTGKDKPCRDDRALDDVLTELEDRGLVGWDRHANRYDLHPLVRGVVWGTLGNELQRGVYTSLHAHFAAVPMIDDWEEVSRLEDLTPAIELYFTLIGLGQYDNAFVVFRDRLEDATLYRLSASRQRVELLELLFPDGVEQLPRLRKRENQAYTLNSLALAYKYSGQPNHAVLLHHRAITINSEISRDVSVGIGLGNLSDALRMAGALCATEASAHRSLIIARAREDRHCEAISLKTLGSTLTARGRTRESALALQRSFRMFVTQFEAQWASLASASLAHRALWCGEWKAARTFADRAWELAYIHKFEGRVIFAASMQGAAALELGDFVVAEERLHHALNRARQVNLIEEELPTLIAPAELRRQQDEPDEAREYLNAVWDAAARGPYPLFHADARNVLAQLERGAGNTKDAIAAATQAYRLAWCDGPPYAYHWGLMAAQKHLEELGAPVPDLPPFDPAKFEPMPEVEINPKDEFYVEVDTEENGR